MSTSIAYARLSEQPYWNTIVEYELKLALWFPNRRGIPLRGIPIGLPLEVVNAAQQAFPKLQEQKYWKDQRQVAQWALSNALETWEIFLSYDPTDRLPSCFFVLNVEAREMKGIWRSLYGDALRRDTLARACAINLLRFAFTSVGYAPTEMIHVVARIGLKALFDKHKVPLQTTEVLSGRIQGASTMAQFLLGDLLILETNSGSLENQHMSDLKSHNKAVRAAHLKYVRATDELMKAQLVRELFKRDHPEAPAAQDAGAAAPKKQKTKVKAPKATPTVVAPTEPSGPVVCDGNVLSGTPCPLPMGERVKAAATRHEKVNHPTCKACKKDIKKSKKAQEAPQE